MTDNLRKLNVDIYNEVVTRLDAADRLVEQDNLIEALAHIEFAESLAARLPIIDAADIGLHPDVMLRKASVLASVGREDDALAALHTAHEAIRSLVRKATDGAADLDLVACNLASHLSHVALVLDDGDFADECVFLAYEQATRYAALYPADIDAQANVLAAVGRAMQRMAGVNPRFVTELMERQLPSARFLASADPDDVVAIANVAAFMMNLAQVKAMQGLMENQDLARVDEAIAMLDRLGSRGESAERAKSLRMLRETVVIMNRRAATAAAEPTSRPLGDAPPSGPLLQSRITLTRRSQLRPEGLGQFDRRARLYEHVKSRIAELPCAQASAIGQPLGDGAGMEQVVRYIEPIFEHERSLLRWVALRGALAGLSQLGQDAWFEAFPHMVGLEYFHDNASGVMGFRFRNRAHGAGTALENACAGVAASVLSRVARYDEYAQMTVAEVNASTAFETPGVVNDAMALDFIAWIATAELRLEASIGASLSTADVPEPSALEAPGWYVEPLFSKGERYWDGRDWTAFVRLPIDGHYRVAPLPLRP